MRLIHTALQEGAPKEKRLMICNWSSRKRQLILCLPAKATHLKRQSKINLLCLGRWYMNNKHQKKEKTEDLKIASPPSLTPLLFHQSFPIIITHHKSDNLITQMPVQNMAKQCHS